ncbi:MAG: AGE family epimerase/isomerase, partial [Bacteroidota bacterium]
SEYYKATHNQKALDVSKELYHLIEKYSYDKNIGGYLEAFSKDWQPITDLRLSEKDDNEKITANTHLHVVEAYANLYMVWPDEILGARISALLKIFSDHFIRKDNYHLNLFLDENWMVRSSLISYGHDIEAGWLLLQCAEILGNREHIEEYKRLASKITDAAAEALDKDGGLWYEYEPGKDIWVKEKHSWSQAEAMIGFMNAYQLSGNEEYLKHSLNSWEFVKRYIKDNINGEWFWGVDEINKPMEKKDKAGFWKCPYHSTRAFLEIINRINLQST